MGIAVKEINARSDILVTVGIPTYNRADSFLKQALESVLNQSYRNLEIIVSDNCSTDNTGPLVLGYNDKRIRYVRQEKNIGAIPNMNFCLQEARGTYFLMLHDDDLIDPDFVETCLRYSGYASDKGIIIAGAREIDMQGNQLLQKKNHCTGMSAYEFIAEWYRRHILLFLPSMLFNTEKLKEVGGFQEKYHFFADLAAQFMLISKTDRIDVPDVLASFRVTEGSFGKRAKIVQWCENSIDLAELACSLVGRSNGSEPLRPLAMKTSAERMYQEALRADTWWNRSVSFSIVWKRFRYRYYPTRRQLAGLFPPLAYILFPIQSIKKAARRIKIAIGA